MLFLSQVLGEEEDESRRKELVDVLTRAVSFTGQAQTDGRRLGLRQRQGRQRFRRRLDHDHPSARPARLPQRRHSGAQGNHRQGRSTTSANAPCPTAACNTVPKGAAAGRPSPPRPSPACSTPATTTDKYVPKLLDYCESNLANISNQGFGHWHYAHYYYAQVLYREGGKKWEDYRDKIFTQAGQRSHRRPQRYVVWNQGYIGPIYTTAINLTILQLDNGSLPIYQR